MDNNNNEMPPVGSGVPEPPMAQPTPVQPIVEQPAAEQLPPQPAPQPMVQPITNQPTEQPVVGADANGAKKKKGLVIGCCVGVGIAVVALVAVLLIFFLKGGEKTVSCTVETSVMGIEMKNESNIKIRDGEIYSADVVTNVNLKSLSDSYKNYEDQFVDSVTKSLEGQCTDHCKFNRDYVAGEYLKLTMEYDGEGTEDVVYTYGIEGKSAQEIADRVQESMERTSGTTCKQL